MSAHVDDLHHDSRDRVERVSDPANRRRIEGSEHVVDAPSLRDPVDRQRELRHLRIAVAVDSEERELQPLLLENLLRRLDIERRFDRVTIGQRRAGARRFPAWPQVGEHRRLEDRDQDLVRRVQLAERRASIRRGGKLQRAHAAIERRSGHQGSSVPSTVSLTGWATIVQWLARPSRRSAIRYQASPVGPTMRSLSSCPVVNPSPRSCSAVTPTPAWWTVIGPISMEPWGKLANARRSSFSCRIFGG